jgi:ATP-dependent helicase HrpA
MAAGCARRQGGGQEPRRDGGAAPRAAKPSARNQAFLPVSQRGSGAQVEGTVEERLALFNPAEPAQEATHKISNRQWEQLLRQNFINIRRVREWRDIHSQLLTVVKEQKWLLNNEAAGYEAVHLSMLSGLLGNIGYKGEESESYLGAHGIKFHPHPGAHLSKKPGRWIVAAEQVETSRLYGRGIAAIEPQWLEEVGGHLLKKQLLDPHWSKKQADVVALERATLYGLVVYNGRRVSYGRVDPHEARNLFIRQALVEGSGKPNGISCPPTSS